jgi:hypothetical protein
MPSVIGRGNGRKEPQYDFHELARQGQARLLAKENLVRDDQTVLVPNENEIPMEWTLCLPLPNKGQAERISAAIDKKMRKVAGNS